MQPGEGEAFTCEGYEGMSLKDLSIWSWPRETHPPAGLKVTLLSSVWCCHLASGAALPA